ncbi:CASP-like protein 4A1 isoform X2 [Lathyrus oleraceus]|uniref:CASP-like protein 4A1 isoform X2 n=1 Tax=Pisum sativum TaxID=3888 RepID=UPI001FC477EE|nr:CASP-like protein 4A1 isoform X2 [Pisum sativum]
MKKLDSEPHHSSDHKQQENEEEQEEPYVEQTTSKSPSPPLHSLSDSPISDDHRSLPLVAQPPVVTAHRFQVEPAVITKVDPGAEEGFVGVKEVEREREQSATSDGGNRRLRPDVSSLLRSEKVVNLNKFLLGLRIGGFFFCLVSFSVLVADRKKGWALDSFYLYKEFRYSLSVNVIGFVYSGLQICDLVKYLISRKHIVEHGLRGYFTFALDQGL